MKGRKAGARSSIMLLREIPETSKLAGGLRMRRSAVLAIGMLLVFRAPALAAAAKTQEVTLPSGADTIAGYLAEPEFPDKCGG